MKKLFFVAAVFAALAIIGCDFIQGAPESVTQFGFTEDHALTFSVESSGDGEVTLVMNPDAPANRALTTNLAKAGVDFYEVVFVNLTTTRRTSWREGQTARITTANGNYDNTVTGVTAYLFAGSYATRTLLAVGVIKQVDGTNGTAIAEDTVSVTFELEALETAVKDDPISSFRTWDITDSDGDYDNTIDVPGGAIGKLPLDQIPANDLLIFMIETPLYSKAWFDVKTSYHNAIVATSTPGSITVKGYLYPEKDVGFTDLEATFTSTPNQFVPGSPIGAALATSGAATDAHIDGFILEMDLNFTNKRGLSLLYFEVPVFNTNNSPDNATTTAALTWYVRNGLSNQLPDMGANHNGGDGSTGGAIVIGVGDVLEGLGFEVKAEQ